jgi:glycosyltransferase involved in cell wall biosynthesis
MPPTTPGLCSVVIPAYQAGRFVARAIESALDQTYAPYEIVVVNDGSTDDTAEVVRGFGDRVRYVEQANGGLPVARNTGIGVARGEFVAFLDADDWWAPARLERCIAELRVCPGIDVVTTDAYLVIDDAPTGDRYYGDFAPVEFPVPGEQLRALLERNFVFVSAVVRRSLLERVGPFDPQFRRAEDYDLWLRVLRAGGAIGLVREPLAYYTLRPDSLSANRPLQWRQHLGVLEKHLPGLWRDGVRTGPGLYFQVARAATAERRYRAALRFLAMGARAPDAPPSARARALARGVLDLARAPLARRA